MGGGCRTTAIQTHEAPRQSSENSVQEGGEDQVLHRAASLYQGFRNNDLLKLKLFDDAQPEVISHQPGKGRYKGLLGSLLVKTPEGHICRVGSD
ncbi:hypothetical protein LPB72_11750 [Hydrogenophaga crassostreae]|uniref:Uncharacterized protein n=1 Tax=Hydrogenophaga crassostreae TaxID=1763535 RepID=A0A167HZY7_9BURK|nr:hypothetical protein LPB072_13130 [Hydrogenophaga crassostreae]OAD41949.1 hypothetical protein LPB72_11750 [Hydrogenophaga crassostreae]